VVRCFVAAQTVHHSPLFAVLIGEIPREIIKLTKLVHLCLSGNHLNGKRFFCFILSHGSEGVPSQVEVIRPVHHLLYDARLT
jgi:hypothetical protein